MLKQVSASSAGPMIMEVPPWKTLALPGRFTVDIPGDARFVQDHDEDILTVYLQTEPETVVHLLERTFDPHDIKAMGTHACLQAAVELYADSHLPRQSPRTSADFEYHSGRRDHAWVCEAVLASDRRSWRVHAVAAAASARCYLLAWTGPRKFLYGPVLEVFESFNPA